MQRKTVWDTEKRSVKYIVQQNKLIDERDTSKTCCNCGKKHKMPTYKRICFMDKLSTIC
jgi:hypothetical protein